LIFDGGLFCEQLTDVLKGLEFEGISRRIQKEHGSLFAGKAFKSDVGLDDEPDAALSQALFQVMPLVPFEDHAIVRDGYFVAIDRIGVKTFRVGGPRFQVDHPLMAIQIKIHPGVRTTPFFAAEYLAVEGSGFL